jgi:hypothetical protein
LLIEGVKIGSFSLGNVVGTLLAGVLVGQLDIHVAPLVKIVFFDLLGHQVGTGAPASCRACGAFARTGGSRACGSAGPPAGFLSRPTAAPRRSPARDEQISSGRRPCSTSFPWR